MTMSNARAVRLLPQTDWGKRLHGPFAILIQDINTGSELWTADTPNVSVAVRAFIDTDPFPIDNRRMAIVDVDGWVVLAYCTDAAHMRAYQMPIWWGSDFGFAVLEAEMALDPLDVAIMESLAKGAAPAEETIRWQ